MQLGLLADRFGGNWRKFLLGAAVIFLCGYDIRQYHILAIEYDHFYEMVTGILLHALHILK